MQLQEENYEQDKRIKTLTFMVEKLKEELSTKEALLMHGKRGRLNKGLYKINTKGSILNFDVFSETTTRKRFCNL